MHLHVCKAKKVVEKDAENCTSRSKVHDLVTHRGYKENFISSLAIVRKDTVRVKLNLGLDVLLLYFESAEFKTYS